MTPDTPSATRDAAVQELRTLADSLRRVDAAAAAADWDDDAALTRVAADAGAELTSLTGAVGSDIAAAAASPLWLERAGQYGHAVAATRKLTPTQSEAAANVAVAVGLARAAVAEAVLAVAVVNRVADEPHRPAGRGRTALRMPAVLPGLTRHTAGEIRHIAADRPRAILVRIVITLGISLSLVAFYHVTGFTSYDAGRLTLYLFSAVVGSVVCTNALCFEAERVRRALAGGDRLWRILVSKNLAMATLVTAAGLPVIAVLTATGHGNFVAMVDQLVTMVFIWLGVGNVLSVVYPLRHEPVSARLSDGTWKPYLFSFALSYGVGLTVNLMIYWRLWSRQTAARELVGGDWAAFALVLASAVTSWVLLTVFAVACSRDPAVRRLLSREMIAYRKPGTA